MHLSYALSYLLLTASLFPLTAAAVESKTQTCSVQSPGAITPADTAYLAGNMADAEALATAQMGSSPTLAAYQTLVRIQLERNELPAALESAKKAVAVFPTVAAARAMLGDSQLRAGDVTAASTAYLAALQLDRCSARAHLGHARINNMTGHHSIGISELRNAHALAPMDGEVTLYWSESEPTAQRGTALRALLDSSPLLPPAKVESVRDELGLIEQQALCTPVEAPTTIRLDIAPLMYDGNNTRSWSLQTRFNGKSGALLELDSSIDGIVLNPKDAEKAGVRPLRTADPAKPYFAIAENVKIGKLEYKNCPVRVVPAAYLANSNSLIGTSFFRKNLIHIDYVDKSLTLRPLPPMATTPALEPLISAEEKAWSPVFIVGANVLLPSLLDKKGPYLFLLDTGASATVFSPSVLPKTLGKQREVTQSLKGTSGEIVKAITDVLDPDPNHTIIRSPDGTILQAYTPFKVSVLRFTNNERLDIASIAFDITRKSHATGVEISGIVGFSILSDFSIDINYRDSLVQVLLDQNHRYAQREARHSF